MTELLWSPAIDPLGTELNCIDGAWFQQIEANRHHKHDNYRAIWYKILRQSLGYTQLSCDLSAKFELG
jgi:hypothetical protein